MSSATRSMSSRDARQPEPRHSSELSRDRVARPCHDHPRSSKRDASDQSSRYQPTKDDQLDTEKDHRQEHEDHDRRHVQAEDDSAGVAGRRSELLPAGPSNRASALSERSGERSGQPPPTNTPFDSLGIVTSSERSALCIAAQVSRNSRRASFNPNVVGSIPTGGIGKALEMGSFRELLPDGRQVHELYDPSTPIRTSADLGPQAQRPGPDPRAPTGGRAPSGSAQASGHAVAELPVEAESL
jgi:hypothetical protein